MNSPPRISSAEILESAAHGPKVRQTQKSSTTDRQKKQSWPTETFGLLFPLLCFRGAGFAAFVSGQRPSKASPSGGVVFPPCSQKP